MITITYEEKKRENLKNIIELNNVSNSHIYILGLSLIETYIIPKRWNHILYLELDFVQPMFEIALVSQHIV